MYRYDPTYHGPLLFYVTGALFLLLGESLTVARLYPALAGTLLVAVPLLLRRRIGGTAAWWSGALVAISPTFLYYSRFDRNDVPVVLFTALALVLLLQVRRTSGRAIPWIGAYAALHAISKETFYVTCPLVAGGAAAVALRQGLAASAARTRAWVRRHALRLATALLWFVAVTVTAYTFGFVHAEDFAFPIKAVSYWYAQHAMQRVGGPWFYHLPRLALYEFMIAVPALVWVVQRRRRLGRLETFCLAWALLGLAAYAYLGEKTPWLLAHQVLPLVPLAGLQLARVCSAHGRWWSRTALAAGVAATVWSTVAASFLYPTITTSDRHAELIVFVQTTPEAGELAQQGREVAARHPDEQAIAVAGEGSWPLSWQWRRLRVFWGLPEAGSAPRLVVCDPGDEAVVTERLGAGYSVRQVPLRGWWVESWDGVGPRQVARWFLTREAWSPIGATDVVVFQRDDVEGGQR